jgi:large subunit ribosomal protein L24
MKLRANDNVLVIRGKDRGKTARIQQTFPRDKKVLVEGVNVVMRHTKPSGGIRQGGIIQKELPMWASKVMLICNHCNRPTKVTSRHQADGTKARACNRCQEVIE